MLNVGCECRRRLRAVVGVLFVLGALLLGGAAGVAAAVQDDYRLGPGDKVKVVVFGHEDLSGEAEVDGSGTVSLPLIRNIPVQGITVRELEEEIANRLKPEYLLNPKVSVEVLSYRPFYIYGEVNKPGSYPYVNGMTVINAVALAGGYTYRARQSRVNLTRASDAQKRVTEAGPETTVFPGDVIEVLERYF